VDNPQGAVDVPLSLFGGMTLELSPPDIPEGLSPDCQDVVFLPGSVGSRPGMHRRIPPSTFFGPLVYEKTYLSPTGKFNLYLDTTGALWREDLVNSPGTVSTIGAAVNGSYATSVTAFGREYFVFSNNLHGSDYPVQYDGTNLDPVTQYGPGTPCTAADGAAGQINAGVHLFVVMFLTRNGFITAPSPYGSWTAAGSKKVNITNLPIGPPDVEARIVAFTGAGGANFFYIPVTPTVSGVAVGTSTVVMDNTSTTATFDFADNTLFNSTAIDIPGNNQFAMQVLPLSLGVFAYSSRLVYWGMDNIVTSFLNMDFNGGYITANHPTGWTLVGSGLLVSSRGIFKWVITGTGGTDGMITQPAYQDQNGNAILQPNTTYTFRARADLGGAPAPAGNLIAELYSAGGGGVLSSASIPISSFVPGGFNVEVINSANFSLATPAVIPSDTVLRIYTSGLTATITFLLSFLEIIYEADPYIDNRAIMSYVNAPGQFDGETGQIGPASDPTQIIACSILRDVLRIKTAQGMHTTQDNGTSEPSGWTVSTFSRTVGVLSTRAGDPGMFGSGDTAEDWDLTASRGGLYLDFAGDLYKISQEIQPLWESINWPSAWTMWIKNDTITRRVYIGLPTNGATTPNVIAVIDYRELDSAIQISTSSPVHISFTGKMISSDLTRKWTRWNIPANCGEILDVSSGSLTTLGQQFCIGYAANSYYFDPAKLTDDDLGQIHPYYTTYAFLNHEAEVALGTGVHRKLYRYLTMFASGLGLLTVTPLVDSLTNSWAATPAFTLQSGPFYDIEWGLNVTGERCFFKIASNPATGTDNSFKLSKMVTSIQAEPFAPVRGAF
jgi:hypothetical protein